MRLGGRQQIKRHQVDTRRHSQQGEPVSTNVRSFSDNVSREAVSFSNNLSPNRRCSQAQRRMFSSRYKYAGETKAYSETLQAACKDPDALFSYPTLKRVLKKLGWKVGPKESDQSGKVGGQKSVWLAPETWAQIENELVYMLIVCTLIQNSPKTASVKLRMTLRKRDVRRMGRRACLG